jgi:hypothetical protein
MSSRVRQNYRQTDIYERLVDEEGIFGSYVDLFVFAACRGYAADERHTEDYTGDAEMLWMHFGNRDFYRAAAACIAYQTTGDPESLMNNERQLDIMAQYASAGADILEEEYGPVKGSPLNSLVNDIRGFKPDENESEERVSPLEQLHQDLNEL